MKRILRLIGVAALMAVIPIACSKSPVAPPQAGTRAPASLPSAVPGEPSLSPRVRGHRRNAGPEVSLPPVVDEAELLQKMIDSLPEAQTVFQHPDPMQAQRSDKVTVRVSRNVTTDLTASTIPLLAQQRLLTEHDTIKVTAFMRVRLSGDPYFKVDSLSDEEQLVDKDVTEWAFSVVPQKAGKWPLHLSITRVFRTPSGAEKVQDYSAKDEFVTVRVMPFSAALTGFARSNWQWLWTTIVVPLAAFLWNHRRKKKAKGHHAGPKKTRPA